MTLFETKAPSIMARLMSDLSLADFQAAAILGNIGHECAGFTQLHQIGGNAIGWPQWDGDRKIHYLAYCKKLGFAWTADTPNYGYLVLELRSTERASLVALRKAATLKAATDVFEKDFERAGVPALTGREKYAQIALTTYQAWKKTPEASAPAPAPVTPPSSIAGPVVVGLGGAAAANHLPGVLAIVGPAIILVAMVAYLIWRARRDRQN